MEGELLHEAKSDDFDAHQFAERHFWAPYHSLERLVFAEVRCLALPQAAGSSWGMTAGTAGWADMEVGSGLDPWDGF